MVIDITLEGNVFHVVIHEKILKHQITQSFCIGNRVTQETYSYLPKFELSDTCIGFGGCLKKVKQEGSFHYFRFDLPKRTERDFNGSKIIDVNGDNRLVFYCFIDTLHCLMHYPMSVIHYDEEKMSAKNPPWKDQSFSFSMYNSGQGNPIGGNMYPWAQEKLACLEASGLKALESYIKEEMDRFGEYMNGKAPPYQQINFTRETWFIMCNTGGRWADWERKNPTIEKLSTFDSHNIDFTTDQWLLFTALVAFNTFLRNKFPE